MGKYENTFRPNSDDLFNKAVNEQIKKIIETLPQYFDLVFIGMGALPICNSDAKLKKYYEMLKVKYPGWAEKEAIEKLKQFVDAKKRGILSEEDYKTKLKEVEKAMKEEKENKTLVVTRPGGAVTTYEKPGSKGVEVKTNKPVYMPTQAKTSSFTWLNEWRATNSESFKQYLEAEKKVWETALALEIVKENFDLSKDIEFKKMQYKLALEMSNCNDLGRLEELKNLDHQLAKAERLQTLEKIRRGGQELESTDDDLERRHRKEIQNIKDIERRKKEKEQARAEGQFEAVDNYWQDIEDVIQDILDGRAYRECSAREQAQINRLREKRYKATGQE